jgi:hypothetical protein
MLIINLTLILNVLGQQFLTAPDMKLIRKNTTSKKKSTFYPMLLDRYKKNDSTITLDEYKHLYYGAVYQSNFYKGANTRRNEIHRLIEKDNLNRALVYCDSIMTIQPISCQIIKLKIDILNKMGADKNQIAIYEKKYQMFMNVIGNSGNGLTKNNAFVVIYVADEYEYLRSIIGMKKMGMQSFVMPFDNMCFEKSDDSHQCLYFLPLH